MTAVSDSFRRVRLKDLTKRFYEIFLDADPRIRPMFQNTDFDRQNMVLMHGIQMLIEYANGSAVGEMAVRRLAEMHDRNHMNVTADLYAVWMDCLMKTLAEKDPKFSPELEIKWRNTLQKGIDMMLQLR